MQIAGNSDNKNVNYGITFKYDEKESKTYGHFIMSKQILICRVYNKKYLFKNKLMAHIR
jgi:hypothetical protein